MYERIERLMKANGLSAYKLSKETGIPQTTLGSWKLRKVSPNMENLQKLSDYFDVPIGFFYGEEEKKDMTIKEKKDIARDLNKILKNLDNKSSLIFDGEPIDDEAKEVLKISLESSLKIMRIKGTKKLDNRK